MDRSLRPILLGAALSLAVVSSAPVLLSGVALAASVPGGYDAVAGVTSVPVTGGQAIATVGGAQVVVGVPASTFTSAVEVVLTSPDLAAIGDGGRPGRHAAAGVGLLVEAKGQPVSSPFSRPLSVQITDPALPATASVVSLGPTAVTAVSQVQGGAQVSLSGPADLVVLVPDGSTVPGATTAQTGVPVAAEGTAGVALVAGGALLLWRARRPRLCAAGLDGRSAGH